MFCQQNLPDDGEAVDNKLCSPVCLHACIYVYIHTHMCTYVCLCLCLINGSSYLYFVCLSICPSTALPIYLSSYLLIYLPSYVSVYLTIYLSLSPSVMHTYIHARLSLSLSLSLPSVAQTLFNPPQRPNGTHPVCTGPPGSKTTKDQCTHCKIPIPGARAFQSPVSNKKQQ